MNEKLFTPQFELEKQRLRTVSFQPVGNQGETSWQPGGTKDGMARDAIHQATVVACEI